MGLSDALLWGAFIPLSVGCNVCTCINQKPTGVLVLPSSLTQNKTYILSHVVGLSDILQICSSL